MKNPSLGGIQPQAPWIQSHNVGGNGAAAHKQRFQETHHRRLPLTALLCEVRRFHPAAGTLRHNRPTAKSLWAILDPNVSFPVYQQQDSIAGIRGGDPLRHSGSGYLKGPQPSSKPAPYRREHGPKRNLSAPLSRAPFLHAHLSSSAPMFERTSRRVSWEAKLNLAFRSR